ncbi:MAG: B-box zinc finger protein [Planctomycetota bacterium]|nr:B-box zinc finger protein [Planctomycetota bacterium]
MSICVNHTNRAATARCVTCHKPLCAECIVKVKGSTYCSQTCADNAARFNAGFRPERGPGLFASIKNLIVSLVGLAIGLAVLVGIGAYVLNIGFCQKIIKMLGL